jgi:hypothetical protein
VGWAQICGSRNGIEFQSNKIYCIYSRLNMSVRVLVEREWNDTGSQQISEREISHDQDSYLL